MLRRLTIHAFLRPRAFLEKDFKWDDFDIERWSEREYEWEQDPWFGLRDTVSMPSDVIRSGRGDCDDYAFVAASYLDATTDHDIKIVVQTDGRVWHMVCYDATEERVYSSGPSSTSRSRNTSVILR